MTFWQTPGCRCREAAELAEWSPFAVAHRYEDWGATDPVDRARGDALIQAALAWPTAEVGPAPAS